MRILFCDSVPDRQYTHFYSVVIMPDAQAIQKEISARLWPGEQIRWIGRPLQGTVWRERDAGLILLMLVAGVIMTGFLLGGWHNHSLRIASGATIPGAIIGYILIGRFWNEVRLRESLVYGITQDRVIIVSGTTTRDIQSVYFKDIQHLSIHRLRNGVGTIILGPILQRRGLLVQDVHWPGIGPASPRLVLISDVKKIHELVKESIEKYKVNNNSVLLNG